MFYSISWQAYWTTLAIVTVFYYLIIYLWFFRKESLFLNKPQGAKPELSLSVPFATEDSQKGETTEANQPNLFGEDIAAQFSSPPPGSEEHIVYSCMDELNAFFEAGKNRKWNKVELIYALKNLLKKYPALKSSEYKPSINNVLVVECKHHCSLHLSASDVVQLWLD